MKTMMVTMFVLFLYYIELYSCKMEIIDNDNLLKKRDDYNNYYNYYYQTQPNCNFTNITNITINQSITFPPEYSNTIPNPNIPFSLNSISPGQGTLQYIQQNIACNGTVNFTANCATLSLLKFGQFVQFHFVAHAFLTSIASNTNLFFKNVIPTAYQITDNSPFGTNLIFPMFTTNNTAGAVIILALSISYPSLGDIQISPPNGGGFPSGTQYVFYGSVSGVYPISIN